MGREQEDGDCGCDHGDDRLVFCLDASARLRLAFKPSAVRADGQATGLDVSADDSCVKVMITTGTVCKVGHITFLSLRRTVEQRGDQGSARMGAVAAQRALKTLSFDAWSSDEIWRFVRRFSDMASIQLHHSSSGLLKKLLMAAVYLLVLGAVAVPNVSLAAASGVVKPAATKPKTKSRKAKPQAEKPAAPRQQPSHFVDDRVTRILRDLKGRAPRSRAQVVQVPTPMWVTKSQWLQSLYRTGLVDSSKATGYLADKLLFYETVRRELGEEGANRYMVRTIGLRDFLVRENLVGADGRLLLDGDAIESKLYAAFPSGFVARPAVGVAPRETGSGLFKSTDDFVAELVKPDTFLYRPDHSRRPIRSTVLDEIASGEAVILQEDVLSKFSSENRLIGAQAKRDWREVRVHTYEGRVVVEAQPGLWIRQEKLSEAEVKKAQAFVAEFLSKLPPTLLMRQAWSVDVLILDESKNEFRIADVVTNRGHRGGWSGYLDQPRVLGAYARHMEAYAGVHFAGLGGHVLRHNAGNYFAYWGVKIEKSRPGIDRVLAWIPPWP